MIQLQTEEGVLSTFDRETLLSWYRQMILIRRVEEEAATAYQRGHIGGFLHLYIGEEAVAVGALNALRPDDNVVVHYRDHGHALARGLPARAVMAELFGKATGCSRGKGGSMHLADATKRFWGGYAIVGGQLALAAGIALADQYAGHERITICFFGDGATNNGYFLESLNLAAVWHLPVIWVCENNSYGMGTSVERASAVTEIYRKACAYNTPAEQIDGQDLLEVYAAVRRAADHVRAGHGPYFIEAVTYRYRGHSMGDPERYRSKEEIERWARHDPIERFKRFLIEEGISLEMLESIHAEVEEEVQDALRFASESPPPPPEALWEDVYAAPAAGDPFILPPAVAPAQ
ncbi:MAG: pyruvate dehydrogenase (acetyl-transferring) E1 component subunit alpha [Ardenticatenia bacterium]|nr:pyruvate dehydrogenase (acetyl-transferring) E1 component subunit alpha [Ardenticatenia bacterium]